MASDKKSIDYKSAGVNIDAGNEAVERIKNVVTTTFTPSVLAGIGGFGSMFDLKKALAGYDHPIMVQGIDGVGTKMIIARKMGKFDTIGMDLVSACTNDIITAGARPMTFLDYIASDKISPSIIEEIVSGIARGCRESGTALVGGETAEMPDTYLKNEHDLVGIVTGFVERSRMITGETIQHGDVILGLPSSGLHTNGYSLARKLFFEAGKFDVNDIQEDIGKTVGEALLEPHINYTSQILGLMDTSVEIRGIAHITGGGLVENIPRILPDNCSVEIALSSWGIPPLFSVMQTLGNVASAEMFRTFNMGVGMVVIVKPEDSMAAIESLSRRSTVYTMGHVVSGKKEVHLV